MCTAAAARSLAISYHAYQTAWASNAQSDSKIWNAREVWSKILLCDQEDMGVSLVPLDKLQRDIALASERNPIGKVAA